jgi:hypothetical protein
MDDIQKAPEARGYGHPAVLDHEVVAVVPVAREDWNLAGPGIVSVVRYRGQGICSEKLPTERLYVWARAGRVTFGDKEGRRMVDLVLLGDQEHEGLALGAPWPPDYQPAGGVSNVTHGAVKDLKNAVTFPISFPRMMKISGARNTVLDALVGFCKREIPDIHVLRGWWRGNEGPDAHQADALPHRGLLGRDGWLAGTQGVDAVPEAPVLGRDGAERADR